MMSCFPCENVMGCYNNLALHHKSSVLSFLVQRPCFSLCVDNLQCHHKIDNRPAVYIFIKERQKCTHTASTFVCGRACSCDVES